MHGRKHSKWDGKLKTTSIAKYSKTIQFSTIEADKALLSQDSLRENNFLETKNYISNISV